MRLFTVLLLFESLQQSVFALPQPELSSQISSGCGKWQLLPGATQYRFGLKSSGNERSYSYHLPSNYNKNKPYSVVLGFHGSSSTGLFFELDSKMSESRFSGNKIMVYPNGIDGSWAGPSYHNGSTIDEDLQFVSDLVADVKSKFCVDESRIYATGMSNGGGFVGTLACSAAGGQFAALAAGSGAFYTDINGPDNGCKPARSPLPILEIHGGSDKTVHYAGGQGDGGVQPPITDWLDWWSKRNECSHKVESVDGAVHHLSWTCGSKEGVLQHYKVDDLGHCWASKEPNLSQISVPQGPTHIEASGIIMKFFDQFSKPS